ncbi:MAG TPA: 30S ribosomal protein S1 [Bryobacteraceae bacterium]|jgi:small subunit ribosomal protein S1|nr:30S ribosomal protein S1 [Bryobacteraceae bacterium]
MENSTSPALQDESSFADILSEFEQQHHGHSPGQALEGTVVSITADSVFVDLGRKMDGALPTEFFREPTGGLSVKIGDRLLVSITGTEDGSYTLSTVKVERPRDWSALERAFSEKRPIGGVVTEMVKGGLRVDVGAKAFMPASRSGAKDQAEMEKLVGQEIECRIIKLDTASEDVVVDRRAVLEEQEGVLRQQKLAELKEGAVVRGTVRSVTDFGAFVDLGGVDGLLHVTDMAWHRVAKPSDVVSVGDPVEVQILKISPETRRISLGMKQLQPDPWTATTARLSVGERVQGKVSRLTDFGAFVEIAPGVDGLIHVSEMSWSKKIKKPGDVLKPGELVEVVVLGVNAAEHRISLGLKQALGDPWEEAQRKYAVGSVVEGTVSSLTNFGCFVDLGNGIEGMIHISDITHEKRLNHPKEAISAGQSVRAVVLELDRERRRIKLGIKQLQPTSVDEYIGERGIGEVVSGRVVDVRGERSKVELGDGIVAECRMPQAPGEDLAAPQAAQSADLSSLTAMLSAKWKQGAASSKSARPEPAKAGQIRSFRITKLDQANKKIEVELAG